MTAWQVGTVGFGYKKWLGNFYPLGMRPERFLRHYATCFDSAEIDTTFYGIPTTKTIENWIERTPDHFIFCPKTPRTISHAHYLPNTVAEMSDFVGRMKQLGSKLGAILIQFPPTLTLAALDDLARFIEALPPHVRYAIEFRDRSWRRGRVLQLLRAHNIAWVGADTIYLPPEVLVSADYAYLRFIGEHKKFPGKDREILDQTARLEMWQAQLTPHLPRLKTVYGFFNNSYSGHSPTTCNRFKTLLGLPTHSPEIFSQQTLF